jgi:FkbM family methyltransferase
MKQLMQCILIVVCTLNSSLWALTFMSQNKQDEFVLNNFFKKSDGTYITDGFFIEFGAYDGKLYSNTFALEELGWKGICIEPIASAFKQLQKNRSCICINGCVSDTTGTALFREVGDGREVLSGLAEKFSDRDINLIENYYHAPSTYYEVPCFKFSTILKEYGVKKIDFLSIDTEGNELGILQSLSKDELASIRFICIEDNLRGNMNLIKFMEDNNFVFIIRIEQDVIFGNRKFMDLASIT